MSVLQCGDDNYIGFNHVTGSRGSVVLFGGWGTNMNSTKALAIEDYCYNNDIAFTRFSYLGAEGSSGKWEDQCISVWKENCMQILSNFKGPHIVIGSSMGGWLMMLVYLSNPSLIKAMIGIAVAPDFIKNMVKNRLSLNDVRVLEKEGVLYPNDGFGVPISWQLIKDAPLNYILDNDKINIECPIRLLHGKMDDVVPYKNSYKIAHMLSSNDVEVKIIDNADHRMNDVISLKATFDYIEGLL